MGYEKKFNKERTKVTIYNTEEDEGVGKILTVIDRETVYEKIKEEETIDLRYKYIKGFSLGEYRGEYSLQRNPRVTLENFNAEGAFFDGGADFSGAVFEGDVEFGRATFAKGKVSFIGATFVGRRVSFMETTFEEGNVSFEYSTFEKGNVSFSFSTFGNGNVDFNNAIFGNGDVDFFMAIFGKGEVSLVSLKIQGDWNMKFVQADIIDFSDSLIHGTVNFTGAKINQLRLIDSQLTGKIFTSSKELRLGKRKNVITSQGENYTIKKYQFRLLKENFRSLGQYDDEDRAYTWFMYHDIRAEEFELSSGLHSYFLDFFPRRILTWDEKTGNRSSRLTWNIKKLGGMLLGSLSWILDSILFTFKWLTYEKMGLYGTSPFRVAFSILIVVLGFSWVYSQLPPPLEGSPSPLFHSVITFLTIGYGSNYANMDSLAGKLFSGIEGFAGLFLMSYFTISFVRKVLR